MTGSLHITKVAFGCESVEILAQRLAARAEEGVAVVGTRYAPKRAADLVGGSLFWILKHRLVARSPIVGFGEAEGGRCAIQVDAQLIAVQPAPRRAHQGWRYLAGDDAPADLGGAGDLSALPRALLDDLAALSLI